ncbi:SusC/RagA family TonB-linked outer membrane protein [Prevotella sp. P2-180]|uniref:SusC/RagA family TonB-linked outer membrane protein n=1 Tax=Prevotella sp. P2-180 TaxID=2024224 RepID=UPI000B95D428|nr:SusC/RagA family TonB-linked outer membrane protein [Prevotella sp. P2-180]OYP68000.1 SusC/RagA family TonB-linked outer membrane protein [Prevotella sp. P2-180]
MREKRIFGMLIALLVCLTTMAQGISMKFKNESLPSVFKKLERATSYKFVFAYSDVDSYTVTGEVTESSIYEVMSYLLKDKPLEYSVKGKIINVSKSSRKSSQGKKIRGVVLDAETGEPIIGATVRVIGGNMGVTTDNNGQFFLDCSPKNIKINVSYVGMESQSLAASEYMNIKLKGSLKILNDVVVVGYGTTKRKDLTGSVAVVKPEELINAPAVTIDDALAGKAAGVQVTKADGSPGGAVRIRVRGGSSLTGGVDPLYIIDGIPTQIENNYISSTDINDPNEWANYGEQDMGAVSGSFMRGLNSLAGLNINDIETITIMKDASATAIYGSKAANGVVIITTKRGRHDQKPVFSFNYSLGISSPVKEKVLNGEQYLSALESSIKTANANLQKNIDLGDLSLASAGRKITSNNELLEKVKSVGNANTDWLDEVLRTGTTHNIDFAVSGGSQSSRYYTSFSYNQQTGTLIGSDFRRLTGNISMDNDISSKFRTFVKLNLSYSKNNMSSGIYYQALSAPPILPIYNADGSYADYSAIGGVGSAYMGFQNPVAVSSSTNLAKTYGFKGSIAGEYDILKELKFKTTISVNYNNYNQLNYIPSYVLTSSYYGAEDNGGGMGTQAQSTSTNVFWENTLTYNKQFSDFHSLNAVIGHSWEQDKNDYFSATGKGYPDDNFLNNLSSASIAASVSGSNPLSKSSLLSFYGRFNYTILDRYLFTFTGRSDTSSKFAKAHRTGFFPSGAFAWRLSEEKWLRDVKWIDEIKLRASIGKTGTQNISDWMFLTLYSPDAYGNNSALYPSQLGNDDIRWESTTQKDLGLDYSFFNGRLSGTIAYYHKNTDGALLAITPAPSSGFSSVISNIANVRNTGFEFEINADFIRNKTWKWSGALNISHNESKVLKILDEQFSSATDRKALNLGTSLIREGESLGLLCGRVVEGLIQNETELAEYKSKFAYWKYFQQDLGIGSVKFALDETGYYYEDVIGNCTPDFYGGYTNTLSYKNWSLLACFTFSVGNDLIYQKDVNDMCFSSLSNRGVRVLEASSVDNFTGKPLSTYSSTMFLTNLNVYDASYLKLQTLSLAYTFNRSQLKPLGLNNLQLYATASNLFTITGYPGPDPAVSDNPYTISGGGRDISSYPTVKSFTFGVRLGF